MLKERRCNLFDDKGRPRRLTDGIKGCSRDASECRFVHPHEREWITAKLSLPPRHDLVADDDSDYYYILALPPGHPDRQKDIRELEKESERVWERSRERDRDRGRVNERKWSSSSILHHNESTSHRRDNMHTRGSLTIRRGSRSPAPSTSSDQLEMLRKDEQYLRPQSSGDYPSSARRNHDHSRPRRSRSRSRDGHRERLQVLDASGKTSPSTSRSHASDAPRTDTRPSQRLLTVPPEPSKTPPVQPPPPSPRVPEIPREPWLTSKQQRGGAAVPSPQGVKALSLDEQRKAWHERIDLMIASITTRRDYTKLESDLSHILLLSSSSLTSNLPEADRANLSAQQRALEFQMAMKRKEINEGIQQLMGSEFWPMLRIPQVLELEKGLGEVKKHVLEVRTLSGDLQSSCAALLKTKAGSGSLAITGFVPDGAQESGRPLKRRRVTEEADASGRNMSETIEVADHTAAELEAFCDKLIILDRHLVDLENDITQRDQIVSDEIDLHIDARLEEEDALYPHIEEAPKISQAEIEAVVDARNEELERAVTTTGDEIGMLATEVAELITKVNTLEAKCGALEAENQEMQNKLAQDYPKYAIEEDASARRDKETQALGAALQAYISQAPTGQSESHLPSAEYIIDALDSELEGLFREKFGATLVHIRQEVFDKVQESRLHTFSTVSPRLMLLLKMVNLITARVGKPDMNSPAAAEDIG
ncbi:hypothetical protein BS17DRAFT_411522 [Gyrodon lividus]|nr:hypothetical protein BS17DRAFT_411522 [Gyrodon lividus]